MGCMGRRWFLIHALSPAISGPDQVEDLCGASLGSDMCACAAADCKGRLVAQTAAADCEIEELGSSGAKDVGHRF